MREVNMKISLMALCMWLSVAIQLESFEKRAISAAQRISASSLDAKLPDRSFVAWLNDLVGQEAGVVWQLAECGVGVANGNGQDVPACAEATVLLPNGDKVIVGISIGTFKKGLVGDPTFMGAVIDSGEKLYHVRRLSDLPGTLHPSKGIPRLPDLEDDRPQMAMLPSAAYSPSLGDNNSALKLSAPNEAEGPPPPPSKQSSGQSSGQGSGELVGANVITSVKPVYPPVARRMGVAGKVDVRVVISETGRVVDATVLSGPMTLRGAAIAAARQWVYKPATRNGVPVKTESVVNFTFGPDQ
jgi:TonB family protein